jgi:hypothetical protein
MADGVVDGADEKGRGLRRLFLRDPARLRLRRLFLRDPARLRLRRLVVAAAARERQRREREGERAGAERTANGALARATGLPGRVACTNETERR